MMEHVPLNGTLGVDGQGSTRNFIAFLNTTNIAYTQKTAKTTFLHAIQKGCLGYFLCVCNSGCVHKRCEKTSSMVINSRASFFKLPPQLY